jgi:hypothetical protein
MSPSRRDDWIDDDEYPDEKDIADLGDESPYDNDPSTIGWVKGYHQQRFWTPARIALAVIVVLIVASLVLPMVLPVLR